MDSHLIVELVAIFLLVLANSFFALAEFSIIASRSSRLKQRRVAGKMGAAAAEKLSRNPERFLASIQVGITLVAAMLGVFSGATMVEELGAFFSQAQIPFIVESAKSISVVVVVLAITVLSVVLGELVPKYMALAAPERFARYIAGPISIFVALSSPFSRGLSAIAGLIVRMFGLGRDTNREAVTEDEINQMIVEGRKTGVFELAEQHFIRSVFEFTDSPCSRAMTPRPDVVGIERSARTEEIIRAIIDDGYSRYPIYEATIDHVVGIIYTKDLIARKLDFDKIDLDSIVREPVFVPDSMPLPKLLRDFQRGKNHMAIVLDEFGGTAGVITLEDVLEELVGEIQDEYDAEAAPIIKHSDSVVFANGEVWPGEINEVLDSHLPEDDVDTLAGLYMDTTGTLPDKYDSTRIADVRLTILAKSENRILRLKLEKLPSVDARRR